MLRAHPRSRGENAFAACLLWGVMGSSPLTRGKQVRGGAGLPADGLIPAHAGKTRRSRSARAARPAHPRSRGENIGLSAPPCWVTGSSPLTRGKPRILAGQRHLSRLIPAHAGKTRRPPGLSRYARAHPRSRGENWIYASEKSAGAGSSPLTRGKRGDRRDDRADRGLIPAHAGKTTGGVFSTMTPGAHPRSRGENLVIKAKNAQRVGSSPLTRGKRAPGCGCRHRRGLIPAHAGKTRRLRGLSLAMRAHPRSRGENLFQFRTSCAPVGSSPLTRGKRRGESAPAAGGGLIPAHAGKTARGGRALRSFWAHPRSRGENDPGSTQPERLMGSSPLTRGKRICIDCTDRGPGLIPAHAGKTTQAARSPSA